MTLPTGSALSTACRMPAKLVRRGGEPGFLLSPAGSKFNLGDQAHNDGDRVGGDLIVQDGAHSPAGVIRARFGRSSPPPAALVLRACPAIVLPARAPGGAAAGRRSATRCPPRDGRGTRWPGRTCA